MAKGIEIKEIVVGTGDEATEDSIVAVSVRNFLRRGDEVSPSPLYGTKMVIDLGRRECIAGLRYGIPGMRVGGTREIVISPHLAYGKAGIPGRIPANALLRCQVELLEIRKHSGLLPQDHLPGKSLLLSRARHANDQPPGWQFSVHESGNSWLSFGEVIPDNQQNQVRWSQVPIQLEAEKSAALISGAIELPKQAPEDCVDWNSGFIDKERCMVVQVIDSGITTHMIGVHEDSPTFRDSAFCRTVEELTRPYLPPAYGNEDPPANVSPAGK